MVLVLIAALCAVPALSAKVSAQTSTVSKDSSCGPFVTPKIDSLNAIASDNDLIYLSGPGELTAFSPSINTIQWVTSIPQADFVRVAASSDAILVVVDDGNAATLLILDKATGLVSRRIPLAHLRKPELAVKGGLAVLQSGADLLLIDMTRSAPVKISLGSTILSSYLTDDFRLLAVTADAVETIDLTKPALRASARGDFSNVTVAMLVQAGILTGKADGTISLLRSSDLSRKWSFRAGGRVSAIRSVGEDILISSHDNFIYRIDANNGSVEWKKRIGGRILHGPGVSESFVFVTDTSSGYAEILDLKNGRTVTRFQLGEDVLPTLPTVSSGDYFVVATTTGLFGFRISECK